jgi:L-lactate dehydrogenase complex protein LldG
MARAGQEAMSARDLVFGAIRRSLGVTGREAPRRKVVDDRIASHPAGVVPARGQLPGPERLATFVQMLELASGTVARAASLADVPAEVAAFLRRYNLPMQAQRGADPLLAAIPWEQQGALTVAAGPPDPASLTAVTHAFAGVAETGTLALASGADNPTSLNFLPDNHIVVLAAKDVVGDYEAVWRRLRDIHGEAMPRTVNLITGPSRTADIEQTLILGAHGPRRLHVILVGEAE